MKLNLIIGSSLRSSKKIIRVKKGNVSPTGSVYSNTLNLNTKWSIYYGTKGIVEKVIEENCYEEETFYQEEHETLIQMYVGKDVN